MTWVTIRCFKRFSKKNGRVWGFPFMALLLPGMALGMALFLENMENNVFSVKSNKPRMPILKGFTVYQGCVKITAY